MNIFTENGAAGGDWDRMLRCWGKTKTEKEGEGVRTQWQNKNVS